MIAPNGTVFADNTTLRAAARCDTELALRHVLGMTIEDERIELDIGIAVHEVLADYFRGTYSAGHCLQKFTMLWRPISDDLGLSSREHPKHNLSWENTHLILDEWFIRHPMNGFPFGVKPGLVEVAFQQPLSDECVCGHDEAHHDPVRGCQWRGKDSCTGYRPAFVFWGRLDAIVQAQHDGGIYVLDHKTTSKLSTWKTEKYRVDSQMSGYTWAAQKQLGRTVTGVFINFIEFAKLPSDPVRKCKTHGLPYAECGRMHMNSDLLIYGRTPAKLEKWRQTAISLARKYRDLASQVQSISDLNSVSDAGTFHDACGFCTFKKYCAADQPQHYADSILIHAPWHPMDPKEAIGSDS